LASRFVEDRLLPGDLLPGRSTADTTADLCFSRLNFGQTTRTSRIDLPSSGFDRIGASLVLPYLFDPLSVLEEFHRILDDGGVMVVSSLKPNYDASKSYMEEAEAIAKRADMEPEERERLLASLREFSSFVARLVELEDEGRFRFFPPGELVRLVEKAGFSNVRAYDALGTPPSAVIVRAEKRS